MQKRGPDFTQSWGAKNICKQNNHNYIKTRLTVVTVMAKCLRNPDGRRNGV